jgi:hypothetical protein
MSESLYIRFIEQTNAIKINTECVLDACEETVLEVNRQKGKEVYTFVSRHLAAGQTRNIYVAN